MVMKNKIAFEDLLKEAYPDLCKNMQRLQKKYRRPSNEDEVYEMVNNTVTKCMEKRHLFDGRYFKAWAKKIQANLYKNYLKKENRYKKTYETILDEDGIYIFENFPDTFEADIVNKISDKLSLKKCMEKLNKKQYKFFLFQTNAWLKTGSTVKHEDLATMLKQPLGSVSRILLEAKKILGECLEISFYSKKRA